MTSRILDARDSGLDVTPGKSGTSSRVLERTLGTFVGIGASLFFMDLIGTGSMRIPLYIFIGTVLILAFINANYPIAIAGITDIVITLFTFDGEPLSELLPTGIVRTLIAAVVTIAASFLWPYRTKTHTFTKYRASACGINLAIAQGSERV